MELPFELPPGVELAFDVSPASWIAERLLAMNRSVGVRVGEIVPTGFESYVRMIFHPVRHARGPGSLRWSELAARNGRVVHPEMQLEHIVGDLTISEVPGLESPLEALSQEEVVAVGDIVRPFTSTPERCWFAVWNGYGIFGSNISLSWSAGEDPEAVQARERIEIERAGKARAQLDAIPTFAIHATPGGEPLRAYYLFRGEIEAAATMTFDGWDQPPNLWWPEDRAWCVASEIDGYSTYIGGTAECIAAILDDGRLEALASDPRNRSDLWSDRVNPLPPGLRPRWDD